MNVIQFMIPHHFLIFPPQMLDIKYGCTYPLLWLSWTHEIEQPQEVAKWECILVMKISKMNFNLQNETFCILKASSNVTYYQQHTL